MREQITLKYRWRQTWPDKPDDYSGRDPGTLDHAGNPVVIGRFYLAHVPGGMAWRWFMQWMPERGGVLLPSGIAESEREAARAIEDAYDAVKPSAGNTA